MGEEAAKVIGSAPCKVLVVPKSAQIGYQNILIATDGSKHSEAAANEAVNIAKRCGSRITVVSVSLRRTNWRKQKRMFTRLMNWPDEITFQ